MLNLKRVYQSFDDCKFDDKTQKELDELIEEWNKINCEKCGLKYDMLTNRKCPQCGHSPEWE